LKAAKEALEARMKLQEVTLQSQGVDIEQTIENVKQAAEVRQHAAVAELSSSTSLALQDAESLHAVALRRARGISSLVQWFESMQKGRHVQLIVKYLLLQWRQLEGEDALTLDGIIRRLRRHDLKAEAQTLQDLTKQVVQAAELPLEDLTQTRQELENLADLVFSNAGASLSLAVHRMTLQLKAQEAEKLQLRRDDPEGQIKILKEQLKKQQVLMKDVSKKHKIESIKRGKRTGTDMTEDEAAKAEKKWTRLCAQRDECQTTIEKITADLQELSK